MLSCIKNVPFDATLGDAKNQYPSRNISFSYQRVIHVVAILL